MSPGNNLDLEDESLRPLEEEEKNLVTKRRRSWKEVDVDDEQEKQS